MSRASKLTLAATSLFAVGTIVVVHFQQKFEKEAMHAGVIRDMEQQRVKRERQLDFDLQKALEAEYKKEQTVKNSVSEALPPAPAAASGQTAVAAAAGIPGAPVASGGTGVEGR